MINYGNTLSPPPIPIIFRYAKFVEYSCVQIVKILVEKH